MLGTEIQLARRGVDLGDPDPIPTSVGPDKPGSTLEMVWLGDSTAAGVGASAGRHALPSVVAAAQDQPVHLRVLAVSGARVADVLARQVGRISPSDSRAGDRPPEVILLSVGANDSTHLTRRDRFRRDYELVLDALPRESRIVVLGVPDMGAPPRLAQPLRALNGWRGRRLDAVVRDLAAARNLTYVPIAARTGPAFRRDHGLFARDRYHPDDGGYRLWATAVLDSLGDLTSNPPASGTRSEGEDGAPT